ncbi:hypothetical protein MOQ19_10200 [Stenotrophomonas maltophilia]|uniref:hypothetical protein n=1 Tax=Stenotrophomonas sepilia TaxID=2860290 RepID=UPI001F53AC10|nr:hypothetical protein [Stenotrophomonas sepilia]MCI1053878.1 hypothetical protein [Stenotrophomonas maltophilia]
MNKEESRSTSWLHFILIGLTVAGIQVAIGFVVYKSIGDWPTRGQFGDMFGAVNSLFSGLAFAGLIYAISLQRKDLKLQRDELQMTREELKRSADAQHRSAELADQVARDSRENAEVSMLSAKIAAAAAVSQSISNFMPFARGTSQNGKPESQKLRDQLVGIRTEIDIAYRELNLKLGERENREA